MSPSREPTYYEIALTHRQVVMFFVLVLACLLAAFFLGVWVGEGEDLTQEARLDEPAELTAPQPGEPLPEGAVGERSFFSDDLPLEPADDSPTPVEGPAQDPPPRPRVVPEEAAPEEVTEQPAPEPRQAPPPQPQPRAVPDQPAPTRTTLPPGSEGFVVQVFSSRDQAQAQKVLDRLLASEQDAFLLPQEVAGEVMYRVRIGPFRQRAQAEDVAERVRSEFGLDTWITQ